MSAQDPYRERVMDHYKNPRNYGAMQKADAVAKEENLSCGDEVTFYLRANDDGTLRVQFTSASCAICRASASMLSELADGKMISEIAKLERSDVLCPFEGSLDRAREGCALLPLVALKSALSEFRKAD